MSFTLRPGETVANHLPPEQAGLVFIGRLRTPWTERQDCPRQGRPDGPLCRIEIFPPWAPDALEGIDSFPRLQVLYWLHLARRDLLRQRPAASDRARGTFALRSPLRPNPIGSSVVELLGREGPATLLVRGLDCLDGTPLLDLKPERHGLHPPAPEAARPA